MMRSTKRKTPTKRVVDILASCEKNPTLSWEQALSPEERAEIRRALSREFGGCCAYCGRRCLEDLDQSHRVADDGTVEIELGRGTIDHFRPREAQTCGRHGCLARCECGRQAAMDRRNFNHLVFVWDNLYYACYRCNQLKANCWPVKRLFNHPLAEGFVDPVFYKMGGNIFVYDVESGVIDVNDDTTNQDEKQLGRNTIDFCNLNSDSKLFPPPNANYPDNQIFADYVIRESNDNDDVLSLPKQRQAAYAGFQTAFEKADDQMRNELCDEVASGRAPFADFIAACFLAELSVE